MASEQEDLASRHCVPCRGGIPPLEPERAQALLSQLSSGWRIVEGHHLQRVWVFPDFVQGLTFTNKVGELAEQEGHHPDIHLSWGRVEIDLWTHKINGLTQSDFILAAKIDKL